ncbi:hypothetical protein J2X31_002763 [Flavobacterium arsenatis]|uniref:DUF3667 domain-containing protein n=1 Tax=Flavobacterium arsenatis TaxID=1484332 RepID=A0ABU1TS81_9FLAO|nr:DUF3667 domain-containing protein [Flavobacterium arsenatis]MDR6968737.1 hypothetical protein [Flavobacterium arsenatis]
MSEICKNCTEEITLNFCPNCGQKKAKRIDRTYIKDELQYTVLHMNKGFFYSIKKILKGPGKTAREFLEGNRVNHYKPLLLVFVVAGISAFITNTLIHPDIIIGEYFDNHKVKTAFDMKSYNSFIYKYQAILMLASVPFMAFFTWLVFKKWNYNYCENVVITAYSLIYLQVLSIIIVVPVQYLLKDNPELFMPISSGMTFLLMIGCFIWFYIDFYNNKSAGDVIMRLFLMVVIFFVIYLLLIIIGIVGVLVYCYITGIDPKILFPQP